MENDILDKNFLHDFERFKFSFLFIFVVFVVDDPHFDRMFKMVFILIECLK